MKDERKQGVSRTELDSLIFNALKRHENLSDVRMRRRLNEGETVGFPSIGIDDLQVTGQAIEVLQYPDGRVEPIVPNVGALINSIFVTIVLTNEKAFSPSGDLIRFVRKYMKMTQQGLATSIGIQRAHLNKIERKKEKCTLTVWLAVKGIAFHYFLNNAPDEFRKRNSAFYEDIQDLFSRTYEGVEPNKRIVDLDAMPALQH